MENPLIDDDPRYDFLYDVENEAAEIGNVVTIDINAALTGLLEKGPVLKGSVRELLNLKDVHSQYTHDRPSYSVLSYEMCDKVFRDNDTFTSDAYEDTGAPAFLGRQILTITGEDHHRLRATSQMMFLRPKAMTWWKDNWIDDAVNVLMDKLATRENPELNMHLCARLPVYVVTVALGIAGEDALNFRYHMMSATRMSEDGDTDKNIFHFMEMQRMLSEVLEARKVERQEDVISGLLDADFKELDGTTRKLTDDEIFGYCRLLLLAGGGTTWRQLGITLYGLLSNYHFWEMCREDRSMVDAAIEEAARWNATDPIFPRVTSREVEIGGVTIPANAFVEVCLGAANHDPARWDNPSQFDITRKFKQHLAFGIGPHHCLGQYVARQEMRSAINALLDRFPNMRIDPDKPAPRLTGGLEQRGMSALPVILN